MKNINLKNIRKIGNMENLENVKEDNRNNRGSIEKNEKKFSATRKTTVQKEKYFLNGKKKGKEW